MNHALVTYYRCPESLVSFRLDGDLSAEPGYFRLGGDTICYGQSSAGSRAGSVTNGLYDVSSHVRMDGAACHLPFHPDQVVDNLRRERYMSPVDNSDPSFSSFSGLVWGAYYLVRPILPVGIRRHLQRAWLRGWQAKPFPRWPVDCSVEGIVEKLMALAMKAQGIERIPFIWFWPQGHSSCVMLTHDVETKKGVDFCTALMSLDESFGFKSSFHFIPEERYQTPAELRREIVQRGFEVNVHDLNHDRRLFREHKHFPKRAARINEYAREFGARGFRSGVLDRNLEWFDAFQFSYDMSVPNVGHLDPQPGGCCTVMPFFIGRILELPLTTTQDYSLFHILGEYSIDLWKRQISLIREKHGLISFDTHPDYVREPRARQVYESLLGYLAELRASANVWMALPGEVDDWWRQRSQMQLVTVDGEWRIEGPGSERAQVAYATLAGDTVSYGVDS